MLGIEREKKWETTKTSVAELKMCKEEVAMAEKKFETTKTRAEELKMCAEEARRTEDVRGGQKDLNVAKATAGQLKMHMTAVHAPVEQEKCVMAPEELKVRPPAAGAQGMLHPALSKASRYPAVLAGVAALTGISTFLYYRTVNVEQLQGKADEVLDSFRPGAAASTDAPR